MFTFPDGLSSTGPLQDEVNEVKAAMNDTGRSLAAIQTYHHENNIEMVSSELMTARQQLNVNLHQVINDLRYKNKIVAGLQKTEAN